MSIGKEPQILEDKPYTRACLRRLAVHSGCSKNKFSVCKDIEYRRLLNLLDNYLPLVLTIYTVTFKLNNFTEYFHGMIRIWTMFVCLERRHYNKAPLVWLAMVTHWGMHYPGLYQMLQSNLVLFDEYPVENAHSIIRARTNDSDTAEQLIQKAKLPFKLNKPRLISGNTLHPLNIN